ncbi:Med5-domain-containing protein [Lophium mytilinum]|uniref:Mediator of RNA polymerase II transcription subunit 5 n=1 Tax=Lophium mytilinum TaxID=390894 RepID=A0A6A6QGL2_9PEZI|nr:Med5-domain-containing protein [Lophium mytilinum]
MESPPQQWTLFFSRCLSQRIRADVFEAAARQLHARTPIAGAKLADVLLRPRTASTSTIDPLLVVYLERLLALNRIDAADVLIAAFRWSRDRPSKSSDAALAPQERWQNPPELDEIIFHRLHKAFATPGDRPRTKMEARKVLTVVGQWMSAMVTAHAGDAVVQAMTGVQQLQQQSINVREALGMLVMGVIDNMRMVQMLNAPPLKELRKAFSQSLSSFIPLLEQTSPTIASRLEESQTKHALLIDPGNDLNGGTGDNGLAVASIQLESLMDLPTINTRAGLYIFLNSLLVARPLTDDVTILNYLHARYKLDTQTLAIDLITASFDILSNAMYRSESNERMNCLKSFLINRIPPLVAQLQGPLYGLAPEFCITQALSHVDLNAFPAPSQGFNDGGGNNVLSDVRQDFLNACALHNLIAVGNIERHLGERPMQEPPEVKYVKEDLLKQCKESFEKVNMFIDEIENMDGNAGAIVLALTEFISYLCDTNMTPYLKSISNLLSKKPQALDVMLLFTSPASILQPLCGFLDNWQYDGDQGEYQPVYDEFGAILVLILAFVHRHELTYHDLGIQPGSFISQILERGHLSIPADELTDEQGRHLGGWLRGLLTEDSAAIDDVMKSCRMQDFYLLMPTLFSQIIYACSAEVLSMDSVKGALEYLLETFLLPSLVGALTWMTSHALEQNHQDVDVLMQIFHKLIRPNSISGDAQTMHSTILSMVSTRLDKCLRTLRRRDPARPDIEPLLETIKVYLHYERSSYASITDLDQWTSTPGNTLRLALRNTIRDLSMWSSNGTIHLSPPSYTHRQLFTTSALLGAHKTLHAILDEVTSQTSTGNGAVALDIATALICAPSTQNSPLEVVWVGSPIAAIAPPHTRINLREMLKVEYDNAASIYLTNSTTAETMVRLHRRVEAQLAAVGAHALPALNVDVVDVQHAMPDIDMSMSAVNDAAAAAVGSSMAMDQQSLERGLETHLDLSVGGAGGGLDLGGGAMDLGLDLGGDMGMGMGLGDDDDAWGLDFDNM